MEFNQGSEIHPSMVKRDENDLAANMFISTIDNYLKDIFDDNAPEDASKIIKEVLTLTPFPSESRIKAVDADLAKIVGGILMSVSHNLGWNILENPDKTKDPEFQFIVFSTMIQYTLYSIDFEQRAFERALKTKNSQDLTSEQRDRIDETIRIRGNRLDKFKAFRDLQFFALDKIVNTSLTKSKIYLLSSLVSLEFNDELTGRPIISFAGNKPVAKYMRVGRKGDTIIRGGVYKTLNNDHNYEDIDGIAEAVRESLTKPRKGGYIKAVVDRY